MSGSTLSPSADTPAIVWNAAAGDFKVGVKTEVCKFDYNGRRYLAYRDTAGNLLAISKRERSNRQGVFYTRLNLKGAAARKILPLLSADPETTR